jgi:hypothetical protein
MSLRDLVDRKSRIAGPGDTSFDVRGLSLEDLVLLLENHSEALARIFAGTGGTDFEELLKEFPQFVAALIAYAADEPELENQVRKLPVGVQLRALEEVWELSSLDVETVGKLAVNLLNSIGRLNTEHLDRLRTSLTTSSEAMPTAQSS